MRSYLRGRKRNEKRRGTALAIALMVMVTLTAVGMVALNAASYDVASEGAFGERTNADSVAEVGAAVARCEACNAIDGIIMAMDSQRVALGSAASFDFPETILAAGIDNGGVLFRPPSVAEGRGSFGSLPNDAGYIAPTVSVTMDRGRESESIAGYSMRETAGSDSGAFCFRYYRFTSTGIYTPPAGASVQLQSQHRSYVSVGPMPCSAL